ncbi:MAG: hypothetical protein K6T72_00600 [Anoxybacillus sp.]|nr:hypothetical protein [Anoxybacillus sp.]MCL6585015.1 hypothetical protein [Anoxybacillus sp.]
MLQILYQVLLVFCNGAFVKRKLAVFLLLALILVPTTGLAKPIKKKIEVIFGAYQIQLNSKATQLPTLTYQNTIYVPIRVVQEMGEKVEVKNGKVHIQTAPKEDGITKKDVNKLKLYNEMQLRYKEVQDFSDALGDLYHYLGIVVDEYEAYGKSPFFKELQKHHATLKTLRKQQMDSLSKTYQLAKSLNVNISEDEMNLNDSYILLNKSLGFYEEAIKYLEGYISTGSAQQFNEYLRYASNAADDARSAFEIGTDGYTKWFERVKKY